MSRQPSQAQAVAEMSARTARAAAIADDLRTVYAGLQQRNVPVWLKLDLTMAQFKALVTIERDAGASVCEVGRELSIGESAASLLIDQLVRRGDVERVTDPNDRRRVRLTVSAHGREVLGELHQGSRQTVGNWLDELDGEQLDALAEGLRALALTVAASASDTNARAPESKNAQASESKDESVNA
jgi:DNA-binding MarR family transcriptional regulator